MAEQVFSIVLVILIVVGIGILFYFGEKQPIVEIDSNGLRIKGMYGRRVEFSDITGITLLEESMRELGIGWRTNGYGGLTLKGHFGAKLLFVSPGKAPTIRIERSGDKNIYISYRDAEQTRQLFSRLSAAIPTPEPSDS